MARMPSDHYKKIQKNLGFIYENIINIDGVKDYLFEKNVLSDDQERLIESIPKGRKRVKALLDIVMTECGDCYYLFLEALKTKNLRQIADRIDRDPDNKPPPVRMEPPVTRSQSKVKVEGDQMIPGHLQIWTRNQEVLVKEFKGNIEDLMRKFFSKNIINMDDKEKVRREVRENYTEGGATKLVEILSERGEMVLLRIIEALKTNYGRVAAMLEHQLANLEERRYSVPIQETGS